MRSGVLTDNDTGGAAQVAAAHCQKERTLDPTACSQTDPPMPQPAALWPSPRNVLEVKHHYLFYMSMSDRILEFY